MSNSQGGFKYRKLKRTKDEKYGTYINILRFDFKSIYIFYERGKSLCYLWHLILLVSDQL